jgi:Leucine rich repeat
MASTSAIQNMIRRLPLRFSMRAMLAVMLVAAVLFAWFGWRLRKSQRQARAVAVLQQFGAVYGYDFQGPIVRLVRYPFTLAPKPGRSRYPRRLHELVGIDFLHNVTSVHLETTNRLTDEEIDQVWEALADLPDLTQLEASGPVTRPGAIQRLRQLRQLQRLSIRWGHLADEDLAVLKRMPRLESLNLNETPITGGALEYDGQCQNLQSLELHHTAIGNLGLRALAGLPKLKRLRLSGTQVGDEGIHDLQGLENITDLDIEHTAITNDALETIATLKNLERLNLSLTSVTDVGIAKLTRLGSLKRLRLDGTSANAAALQAISQLPSLEELHVSGQIVEGNLSPLANCPKLRVLSGVQVSMNHGSLKLPPSLEELGVVDRLTNPSVFEELVSLPNLKVINAGYPVYYESENIEALQRFRAARPNVDIVHR